MGTLALVLSCIVAAGPSQSVAQDESEIVVIDINPADGSELPLILQKYDIFVFPGPEAVEPEVLVLSSSPRIHFHSHLDAGVGSFTTTQTPKDIYPLAGTPRQHSWPWASVTYGGYRLGLEAHGWHRQQDWGFLSRLHVALGGHHPRLFVGFWADMASNTGDSIGDAVLQLNIRNRHQALGMLLEPTLLLKNDTFFRLSAGAQYLHADQKLNIQLNGSFLPTNEVRHRDDLYGILVMLEARSPLILKRFQVGLTAAGHNYVVPFSNEPQQTLLSARGTLSVRLAGKLRLRVHKGFGHDIMLPLPLADGWISEFQFQK